MEQSLCRGIFASCQSLKDQAVACPPENFTRGVPLQNRSLSYFKVHIFQRLLFEMTLEAAVCLHTHMIV